MNLKKALFLGVLAAGITTSQASDESELIGKRTPPKAPVTAPTGDGVSANVLADIIREMQGEDTEFVIEYVNKLYSLKAKYKEVLAKEVELRQSKESDDAQKELVTAYLTLLNEEKALAKEAIDTVNRDLEAQESRLLQVTAKIFRIGDTYMKRTIMNLRMEVKKSVRYKLMNSQGNERAFYVDVMRFLDHYFRG